jgi:hypothetical protein
MLIDCNITIEIDTLLNGCIVGKCVEEFEFETVEGHELSGAEWDDLRSKISHGIVYETTTNSFSLEKLIRRFVGTYDKNGLTRTRVSPMKNKVPGQIFVSITREGPAK